VKGHDASRLTVVVPVLDRRTRILEAVESVAAQRRPDGVDRIEVVIVDDGSTDGTRELLTELVADQGNGAGATDVVIDLGASSPTGPAAARNRGIRLATGHWITFLDSDDVMLPDRLVVQHERLHADPPCTAVIGSEILAPQRGVTPPAWVERQLLAGAQVGPHHTSLYTRTSDIRAIGGFDESIRIGEDIDLTVRFTAAGGVIAHVDAPVLVRRFFGDNLVYADDEVRSSMLRSLRRHRQRGEGLHRT
jgi:glycosyltransferase involved in cell wall biosynthesis